MTDLTPDAEAPAPPSDGLRRIVWYSLLGGLCPLLPIPFLDDAIVRYLRKRMYRGQLRPVGIQATSLQLDVLAYAPLRSMMLGCLIGAVWTVFKRIFRKIFYVLAVKDCVDVASSMFHEGWLFQHAIREGRVTPETFADDDKIREIRELIRRTCEAIDTRPINQLLRRAFTGSKAMMKASASALARMIRSGGAARHPEKVDAALDELDVEQAGELEGLLDQVVTGLGAEKKYFEQLERAYEQALLPEARTEPGDGEPSKAQ